MSGPGLHWLRLYTDFVYNRKVIRLPELMQLRLVKLWCLHRAGHLEAASPADIAFELRLTEAEVVETLATLRAAGLLDANGCPHNWEKRQPPSDDVTARTRLCRKRKRERSGEHTGERSGEHGEEQDGNVPGNDQNRVEKSREEQNARSAECVPYAEIVAHLNQRTGSAFRATTKSTRTYIHARWTEGFRLEDFQAVIDAKAAEWLHGSIDGEPAAKYLRPQTLFGPKFESYREAARHGTNATHPSADDLPDIATLMAKEAEHV